MYQRKSDLPDLPEVSDFLEAYQKHHDVPAALRSLGYDDSVVNALTLIIHSTPEYQSEIDRIDCMSLRVELSIDSVRLDATAMLLADLRRAYSGGVSIPPDKLPWDVGQCIKSARYDHKTDMWVYTFVDKPALLDRVARLTGAYEQPDSNGEVHIHLDNRESKL